MLGLPRFTENMPLTREQLATRLRELREKLGFTQAQVAQALSVHRPAISELEAGRRSVTSEELYRLSQLFATSVSTILADPVPTAADVEGILFRRDGAESPAARASVLRFIQRRRDEKELEALLGIVSEATTRRTYTPPLPRTKIEAIAQGTSIAEEERQRLGLGSQPIRNPVEILAQQGVRIGPIESLEAGAIDGLYFETDDLGACVGICVRDHDWTGARAAFTAAHECAHWLLRDVQVEFFSFAPAGDDLVESRANAFAAAFLMPREGLTQYFVDAGLLRNGTISHLSPGDLVRAMDYFGVSRTALLFRLVNLQIIRSALASSLEDFSIRATAKALQMEFRSRGPISARLPQLAVHAWRSGHIGASRAAELCDLDLSTFKEVVHSIGEDSSAYDGLPLADASAV